MRSGIGGWLVALVLGASAATAQERMLVLEGGTLIDGTGRSPVADAVVVVEGARIKAVGARGQVSYPATANVIRLNGRTILPGLIDGHVHLRDYQLPMFLPYGVTGRREGGGTREPGRARAGYANVAAFLSKYSEARGKVLAASDTGCCAQIVPGLSLHYEMQMLTDIGITPMKAIQGATLWAAEVIGQHQGWRGDGHSLRPTVGQSDPEAGRISPTGCEVNLARF